MGRAPNKILWAIEPLFYRCMSLKFSVKGDYCKYGVFYNFYGNWVLYYWKIPTCVILFVGQYLMSCQNVHALSFWLDSSFEIVYPTMVGNWIQISSFLSTVKDPTKKQQDYCFYVTLRFNQFVPIFPDKKNLCPHPGLNPCQVIQSSAPYSCCHHRNENFLSLGGKYFVENESCVPNSTAIDWLID